MAPRPPSFKTVVVEVDRDAGVGTLRLNRPRKSNAIDPDMWLEIPRALAWLDEDEDVRAVLLCAAGKNFCAGIDVSSPELLSEQLGQATRSGTPSCAGREAEAMYRHVRRLQESFTAVERCRAPVVCAIQGACFGGGVDLAAACDVRVCSKDAVFCVKEIDLAIVADIGTLQRLPKLIGHGRALEMALTARAVTPTKRFASDSRRAFSRALLSSKETRSSSRKPWLRSHHSRRRARRRRVYTRATTP
jgi:delta(3,5)-delta(2,4)-dienoyl-CoA isomerase